MKRIGLLVFFLVLAISGSAFAAKRVALVVGNGGYADSPLRNPVNDAKDMAGKLRGLGFDVTLLTDAGQKRMEDAIYAFDRKLGGADVRLFYYAGHGMQVAGANYLIPVDASVRAEHDVKYEGVHAGRVLDGMAAAGPGVNILVLDACRNNPFARSFRSASRGLARMDAPSGSMIVYATSPGDVAADGSGRNGIFTKNLLDNIDRKGLTLEQVFKRTGRGVMRETNGGQVPWTTSSVFDDVYLSGKTMVADGSTYGAPVSQSPQKGSLRIESQPSGAQIFLNGNRVGRTPKTLNGLPTGRVTLEARLDGYEPQEKITTVLGGQAVHVGFALTEARVEAKPGRLYVLPDPKDATIKILNIGPKYERGMLLKSGKYHVEVSKSGYKSVRKWVVLGAGEDLDVPVTLAIEEAVSRPKHLYLKNEPTKMSHRLTWDKSVDLSTGNRVDHYIIAVAEAESKRILEKYKTKFTSYQYNRGERGKNYVYRVMAVSTSGTLSAWSAWSNPFTFQYNMELKPPTNIVMERATGSWQRDRKKDILKWSRAVGADGDELAYTVFFRPVTDKHVAEPVVVVTLKEHFLIKDVYDMLDDTKADVFMISITASDGVTKSSFSRPVKYVFSE